jgi:hypothetical protein
MTTLPQQQTATAPRLAAGEYEGAIIGTQLKGWQRQQGGRR